MIEPAVTRRRVPARARLSHAWNLADAVFGLSLAGLLGYSWYLGRGLSFFADDWNLVVDPADHLLLPHFGHFSLVPRLLYRLLLPIVGVHSYTPYRLMGCVAFAVLGVSFYLYLRARVSNWVACFVAVGFIWFSQSDLFPPLFAVLVNYTIPLAATIGIWALLDRRSWKADWLASVLLGLALASSAVGLMAAIAVATEFLVQRAPLRRWLRFAPPVLLWLLWYLEYHQPLGPIGSLRGIVAFTLREFNDTAAALAGGSQLGGWLLAVTVALCLAYAIKQRVRPRANATSARNLMPEVLTPTFTPRAAGALTAAISFAVATATTRRTIFGSQNANVGRYLWVIAFFLAVAFTECFRLERLGQLLALLAGILLVVNGAVLADSLSAQRSQRLHYQATTQAPLAATQAVGTRSNPDRVLPISLVAVHPAEYLKAVARFGAPPGTTGRPHANPATVFNGGTVAQAELKADGWMITDLDIGASPASYLPARCRTLNIARPETVIPPGTLIFLQTTQNPVSVKLRRYAETYENSAIAVLAPDSLHVTLLPHDHSSVPWRLQLSTNTLTAYKCNSATR